MQCLSEFSFFFLNAVANVLTKVKDQRQKLAKKNLTCSIKYITYDSKSLMPPFLIALKKTGICNTGIQEAINQIAGDVTSVYK